MQNAIANEDVSKIISLLSDLIEHRELPTSDLRRRFLNRLGEFLDAPHWAWAHSVKDENDRPAFFSVLRSDAFTEEQFNKLTSVSTDPRWVDDTREAIGEVWGREHFTITREVFQPDKYWFDPTHPAGQFRQYGAVDAIWSLYPLGPRGLSGIAFWRFGARPLFTARERNIVHVVLAQLDWLHRADTDVPAVGTMADLTPREREVLIHLLNGSGGKQIANALKLSEFTVRDHIKELHRKFHVQSRGELFSRFLSGKVGQQVGS